jgi:hypothetical protein
VSDVLSRPLSYQSVGPSASLWAGRASAGIAAVTLSMGVVGGSAPATTSPILVKHQVAAPELGLGRSPSAFTAAAGETRTEAFVTALNEALELSALMVAEDDGDPMDHQTVVYAVQCLLPYIKSLKLPCPVILPLQNGGIGMEWHDAGMNIELRFRHVYDVYAVVEDAQSILRGYHGRDPSLYHAEIALRELSSRSVG